MGRRTKTATAALALLLMLVGAACVTAKPKPRPVPTAFIVSLRLTGKFSSDYIAVDPADGSRSENHETMEFKTAPAATYEAFFYADGTPPKFAQKVIGGALRISGVEGTFAQNASQTSGDNCSITGQISEKTFHGHPARYLRADYGKGDYDMVVQGASNDPFTYTGTHPDGSACGTKDPWHDWVLGELKGDGEDAFSAILSVPQSKFRAALKGGSQVIHTALKPTEGLKSNDCGSDKGLGITCKQDFNWSGTVTIRKAPSQH